MVRAVIAALLAFTLAGCAGTPARTEPPPATCPEPAPTARPHLPIADLTIDDLPDAVMRAYEATVETLIGYAIELETLLNGYRKRE